MKKIEFKNSVAQRIYNDYFKRVNSNLTLLSKEDRAEMLLEINSHIYEGLGKFSDDKEADNLLTVLDKLGAPEEYLKPIVADRKVREALRTFRPKDIYHALLLNLRNGIIYNLFALFYLFLFTFVFLIGAKLFFPSKTGLFYKSEQFHSFGFNSSTNGMNEMLGYWFMPLVLLAAILFYFLITLLFRLIKRK